MVNAELSFNQVTYLNSRARRTFSVPFIAATLLHTFVFAAYFNAEFLPSGTDKLQLESQVIKMSFVQASHKQIDANPPNIINNKPESRLESKPEPMPELTSKVITKPEPVQKAVATKTPPVTNRPEWVQEKTQPEDVAQINNDINVKDRQVATQKVMDNYQPPSSNISYHHNPDPYYPRVAIRRGIEGTVELSVRVDATGLPVNIAIRQSSGYDILDKEAMNAVWKWRFKPAYRGAVAVPGDAIVPIHYQLDKG